MYLVFRTETFARLFFLLSCIGLFLYAILAIYTFHKASTTVSQTISPRDSIKGLAFGRDYNDDLGVDKDLKYILFWTIPNEPAQSVIEGQQVFTDNKCEYINCYLTRNKNMLRGDYKNFDAIVFNVSTVKNWKSINMPQSRSPKQKYIFYSLESSDESPVCNVNADSYFNWTWTYKLSSDFESPFIEVTDLHGNVVAPKLEVKWTSNKTLIGDTVIGIKLKRKALAWITDKCYTGNLLAFIEELEAEMKINRQDFDIYGCGKLECPKEGCRDEIANNYYFYLAHEDSIAEDYVTKVVFKAYLHNAVPIVLGGADYHKFLPDGSYINAKSMSPAQLAANIDNIIRNPDLYYNYFRWRHYYSIHETEEFKGICEVCVYLNDESKFGSFSVYKEFRKWWYPGRLGLRCNSTEEVVESISHVNSSVLFI